MLRLSSIIFGVNVVKISVSDLKTRLGGQISFDFQESWSYLTTAKARLPVVAPVHVWGVVDNTGRTLFVNGRIATILELTCDRCLTSYNYPLKIPLQEEYAGSAEVKNLANDDPQGNELRLFDGELINLRPAVEDAIILALPMKLLCHESCRGLCPYCGRNFNEGQCRCDDTTMDPRLAPLEKLLRKREGES